MGYEKMDFTKPFGVLYGPHGIPRAKYEQGGSFYDGDGCLVTLIAKTTPGTDSTRYTEKQLNEMLSTMSRADLMVFAKDNKIKVRPNIKRDMLIVAIINDMLAAQSA